MTNDTWGLNFTSPIDAKQFRECCVSIPQTVKQSQPGLLFEYLKEFQFFPINESLSITTTFCGEMSVLPTMSFSCQQCKLSTCILVICNL